MKPMLATEVDFNTMSNILLLSDKLSDIALNLNEKSGVLGEGMCLHMKELADELKKCLNEIQEGE